MRIINRSRGNGKTTMLIYTAYITGMPIIVYTRRQADLLLKQAKDMNVDVEVFTVCEWNKLRLPSKNEMSVLVDEANIMIEDCLKMYIGSNIAAATMTIPMDDNKSAENNDVRHGKWEKFEDCSNEGVCCSRCHKKVFKLYYANQALQSKYCPNCGARMDLED